MKKVEVKTEIVNLEWEAVDGTRFNSEKECTTYEESAWGVLMQKYMPLVIKTVDEYSLSGFGSDDNMVDIVRVERQEDVDIIYALLLIGNSYLNNQDNTGTNANIKGRLWKLLTEGLNQKSEVLVFRGYNNESFWIVGSVEHLIENIKSTCKPQENGKEN